MAYEVDTRAVSWELERLTPAVRVTIELKLKSVAKFAELTPPPSIEFLLLEGIDPATVFRFDLGGLRVRYEIDPDAKVLRVLRITRVAASAVGS